MEMEEPEVAWTLPPAITAPAGDTVAVNVTPSPGSSQQGKGPSPGWRVRGLSLGRDGPDGRSGGRIDDRADRVGQREQLAVGNLAAGEVFLLQEQPVGRALGALLQ